MLNPKPKAGSLLRMTRQQREEYDRAIAEEIEAKPANIAAARESVPRLQGERKRAAELIAALKAAREAAGVSLDTLESRTGIQKSALSRLENSKAPNPTLATLQRYATAIDRELIIALK